MLARCPRCGAEMVPMRIGPNTVVWFCLLCPELHVDMGDLWARAAAGGG